MPASCLSILTQGIDRTVAAGVAQDQTSASADKLQSEFKNTTNNII